MVKRLDKPAIDDRLLETAIEQIGRHGLEGASTRAIAAAAGTAMSSITYHYGGKHGLYLAAARHIAGQIGEGLQSALQHAEAVRREAPGPQGAIAAILAVVDGYTNMMTSPQSAHWSRFIVREQMDPGPAFDIIFAEVMKGLADRLTHLIRETAGGRLDDAEARVKAIAIIGQALIFRVARVTVLGVTGWPEVTPTEAAQIRGTVHAHTTAILESIRGAEE